MTIDDIATAEPDWDAVLVCSDFCEDSGDVETAQALRWLATNKKWIHFDCEDEELPMWWVESPATVARVHGYGDRLVDPSYVDWDWRAYVFSANRGRINQYSKSQTSRITARWSSTPYVDCLKWGIDWVKQHTEKELKKS
jgi:hypothetical protein